MSVSLKSQLHYARVGYKYGMKNSTNIVREAVRSGIPVSLGFALAEKETTHALNIYGHDPVANRAPKGGRVTKRNYINVYLPDRRAGRGMQGVGPLQLTWYATQDAANKFGGCWLPKANIRVGFSTLAALIRQYGYVDGIKRYNGTGSAAVAYSADVRSKAVKWHNRLT